MTRTPAVKYTKIWRRSLKSRGSGDILSGRKTDRQTDRQTDPIPRSAPLPWRSNNILVRLSGIVGLHSMYAQKSDNCAQSFYSRPKRETFRMCSLPRCHPASQTQGLRHGPSPTDLDQRGSQSASAL